MKKGYYILHTLGLLFLLAFIIPAGASAQPFLESKLFASDGEEADFLGSSVSISGDYALLGARFDDDDGVISGSAYIFELKEGSWVEAEKLTASDAGGLEQFGFSVSLDGDRALIGAPGQTFTTSTSGTAYVFERIDGNWTETARLQSSDEEIGDQFGYATSLYGDYALISARLDDDNGASSGSVYVFKWENGEWHEVAKLIASDGNIGDNLGTSLSFSENRALIGAPNDDDNGSASGSVYVFEHQDNAWTEVAKLTPADGAIGDNFGSSVSLSGNYALIGKDDRPSNGSAYIFEFENNNWIEVASLAPDDGNDDQFGFAVAIHGNRAVVGARFGDTNNTVNSGSAYIFDRINGDWSQVATLNASDAGDGYNFGMALSITSEYILVGAGGATANALNTGAAYVYESCLPSDPIERKITCLSVQVDNLFVQGLIDPNQQSQLSGLLKRTQSAVQNDASDKALESMKGFLSKVHGLIKNGDLLAEDGQPLIDAGLDILNLIRTGEADISLQNVTQTLSDIRLENRPEHFTLNQNYPNPFNPTTTFSFALPEQTYVRLAIYDMLGREIHRVVDGIREAGSHEVSFDATHLPSGTYLYRLETQEGSFVKMMQLLK